MGRCAYISLQELAKSCYTCINVWYINIHKWFWDVSSCFWIYNIFLVGGFNPFEKYQSKWKSSPSKGEHKQFLKSPARITYFLLWTNCCCAETFQQLSRHNGWASISLPSSRRNRAPLALFAWCPGEPGRCEKTMLGSGFNMRGGPMVVALFSYGVPSKLMQHQNCPNWIYFGVLLLWRHSYVWMFWPPNMHIYISSACWKQLFQLCWEMQISAGTLQFISPTELNRAKIRMFKTCLETSHVKPSLRIPLFSRGANWMISHVQS